MENQYLKKIIAQTPEDLHIISACCSEGKVNITDVKYWDLPTVSGQAEGTADEYLMPGRNASFSIKNYRPEKIFNQWENLFLSLSK